MADENTKQVAIVGLTQELVAQVYAFTQNLGSLNELRMIGEKIQGQCQANLLEQLVAQKIEAVRQDAISGLSKSLVDEPENFNVGQTGGTNIQRTVRHRGKTT